MLFTHSFSRTCPVRLSYAKSGRSVEGLAIIDDQCTHSLVTPNITKELHIAQEDLTSDFLIASTVNGIARHKTLIIKDLLITPFSGDAPTHIDSSKTCHIPDALKDLPTPQEVSLTPDLSRLAEKFPPK